MLRVGSVKHFCNYLLTPSEHIRHSKGGVLQKEKNPWLYVAKVTKLGCSMSIIGPDIYDLFLSIISAVNKVGKERIDQINRELTIRNEYKCLNS